MVTKTLKYECDCCGEMAFMPEDSKDTPQDWKIGTEVGDVCPNCSKFWELTKRDFLERMKK